MTATPLILKQEKTDEHLELYETLLKRTTPALVDRIGAQVRALPGSEIDVGIPTNVYVSEAAALACLAEWHMSPRPPVMVTLAAQKKRLGAEVCVELVYLTEKIAGYDLRAVATRSNINVSTVRSHLKSIFAKTGLRSQVELVQRIRNGPALLGR